MAAQSVWKARGATRRQDSRPRVPPSIRGPLSGRPTASSQARQRLDHVPPLADTGSRGQPGEAETCCRLLEEMGHQMTLAGDGNEVLQLLESARTCWAGFAIVLTDQRQEVLRRMKRVRRIKGELKERLMQEELRWVTLLCRIAASH